jgi:tetratricopeptide (TPR) repeat protein
MNWPEGYACRTCSQYHTGVPFSFAADFPDPYANLSREERDSRAIIGSDQCILDSQWFFLRGIMEIPVIGSDLDLAYSRSDPAAIQHELDAAKGSAYEPFVMFFNAAWNAHMGKVKNSRELWQRARQAFIGSGANEVSAQLLAFQAYQEAQLGYATDAKQTASQALAASNDPDTRSRAALAFAAAGDSAKSSSLLESAMRDAPDNRFIQVMIAPVVRAMQQLVRNQAAEALNTLEAIRSYEFGTGPRSLGCILAFVRGSSYLKLHDGVRAAAEFQRILNHRGAASWSIEYPLAELNLGRAYAMEADSTKAHTAYQDFFAPWKDADPDIPVLKEAKAEYADLLN